MSHSWLILCPNVYALTILALIEKMRDISLLIGLQHFEGVFQCKPIQTYKKVLLRERKRHTDRGVISTPSVTQGGVPPIRVPPARSDGGTQGAPLLGYPRARSDGGYPRWCTPIGSPHQGMPKLAGPGRGTPSLQVWTDQQSETITSRLVLRTLSVMISLLNVTLGHSTFNVFFFLF